MKIMRTKSVTTQVAATKIRSFGVSVRALSLCGLLFLLSQWTFAAPPVPTAGSTTTVTNARNGVPVVNIAAPSAAGLSHNTYTSYNVDAQGLVLNNGNTSELFRQSQLAGQVAGNPNLGAGAQATFILNEVTSANRSSLLGFTEVLGGRANVIVANPYGITCNGCGFINTDRVSLVTGTTNILSGAISGFSVNGGDILISGTGLNASAQQMLDLVSRRIVIQGQINTPSLNLVAGTNTWNYNTGVTSVIASDGSATPTYGIDSSALGGMYAGRINLKATEAGVGVRMLGNAAASADDFMITSAGRIEVRSPISAARNLSLTSTAGGGDAISATDASLTAGHDLELTATSGGATLNGGVLVAGNSLTYDLGTLTDVSTATALTDNNKRYAGGVMTLAGTGAWRMDGVNYGAGSNLALTAGSLAIGASGATIYSGGTLGITATSGNLDLADAALSSPGTLSLISDTGALTLGSGARVKSTGGTLSLLAATDLNNAGTLTADDGDVNLHANGAITNSGIVHAAGLLDIADKDAQWTVPDEEIPGTYPIVSNTVTNTGTLQGGTLSMLSTSLSVTGGGNIESAGNMYLGVDGPVTIGSGSRIVAATSGTGTATIKGNTYNSDERFTSLTNYGTLYSGQNLDVLGTQIENTLAGNIGARNNILLDGGYWGLTNAGKITSEAGGVSLKASGGDAQLANSGTISAAGLLQAWHGSNYAMSNTGRMLGGSVDIYADSISVTGGGSIESAGDLSVYGARNITIGGVGDTTSRILAATSGTGTGSVTTWGWYDSYAYKTYGTLNNYGVLFSRDNLIVGGGDVNNKATGGISALRNLTMQGDQARVVNDGSLYAGQDLNSRVWTLDNNSGGTIYAGRDMTLQAAVTYGYAVFGLWNYGQINAVHNVSITGDRFWNSIWPGGATPKIIAGSGGTLSIQGYTFNEAGNNGIISGPTVVITAGAGGTFRNTGTISATTLNVAGGGFSNSGAGKTDTATLVPTIQSPASATASANPGAITASANPFPGLNLTLPTNPNGMFIPAQNPNSSYLVESNPLFTNIDNYLGSDYLAQKYNLKPDELIKRLGDAAYETYLVQQQLVTQLGASILNGYESEKEQMRGLMDHAGSQARSLGLTYGKPLTATQQASLNEDMVWMVETMVGGQKVLAPVVYLSAATRAMYEVGSGVLHADTLNMNVGSLTNTGGGTISAKTLDVVTQGDIQNVGSTIKGGEVSLTSTGGSIVNRAEVKEEIIWKGNSGAVQTTVGKGGTIQSTGTLNLNAQKNVENLSSSIQGQNVNIKAEGDVLNQTLISSGTATGHFTQSAASPGTISATETLNVDAGKNITNLGAQMSSGSDANLNAKGNVVFDTVKLIDSSVSESSSQGFLKSSESTTFTTTTTQVKSGLTSGGNVSVKAQGDVTLAGTDVSAKGNVGLDAGGDLKIIDRANMTETRTDSKAEGLGVGGGLWGIETKTTETLKSRSVGSTITSGSDTGLSSGKTVTIQGSSVNAKGNIDISGEDVKVTAGQDVDRTSTRTVTSTILSIAAPGTSTTSAEAKADAFAGAEASLQNVGTAKAGAGAGADASTDTGAASQSNANASTGVSSKTGVSASAKADASAEAKANMNLGGIDLGRDSVTTRKEETTKAVGSSLGAGNNITITARKKITLEGAKVDAKGDVDLSAQDVNVMAAEDKHTVSETSSVQRAGLYLSTDNAAKTEANIKGGAEAGVTSGVKGEAGAGISADVSSSSNIDLIRRTDSRSSTTDITNVGSSLSSAGNLRINSGNKVTVQGSDISGEQGVDIKARDMEIMAGKDSHTSTSSSVEVSGGFFVDVSGKANAEAGANANYGPLGAGGAANAGAGASAELATGMQGKVVVSKETESTTTARVSTIKSGSGSISRAAENSITDVGTSIDAAGDFTQTARTFTSKAAADTTEKSSFSTTNSAKFGLYSGASANAEAGAGASGGLGATADANAEAKARVVGGAKASYSGEMSIDNEASSKAVASSIKAGGNVKSVTTDKTSLEGTQISAGKDVELEAKSLDYSAARDTTSKSSTSGSANLSANAGVGLSATTAVAVDVDVAGDVKGKIKNESTSTAHAGGVASGGNISIKTTDDTRLEGTNLTSTGDTNVAAGGNVKFEAARDATQSNEYSANASAGVTTSKGKNSLGVGAKVSGGYDQTSSESSTATGGSVTTGGKLNISAGKAASLEGTNIDAGGDAAISGKEGVSMSAARSTSSSQSFGVNAKLDVAGGKETEDKETTRSGSIEGAFGVSGSSSKESTAVGGTVKSGGNLTISSEKKDVTLEGAELEAAGKARIQAGGSVNIKAAESTSESQNWGVNLSGKAEGETKTKAPGADAGGTKTPPNTAKPTTDTPQKNPGTGGTQGSDGSKKSDADLSKWQGNQASLLKELKEKQAEGSSGKTAETSPSGTGSGGTSSTETSGPEKTNKGSGTVGVNVQLQNTATRKGGSIKSGAGGVEITAGGGDVNIEGEKISTTGDANISAKGDVNVTAAKNTESSFGLSLDAAAAIKTKTPDSSGAKPETPTEKKDEALKKPSPDLDNMAGATGTVGLGVGSAVTGSEKSGISTGGKLIINSGGKTTLTDTNVKAAGGEVIDAKGGVER